MTRSRSDLADVLAVAVHDLRGPLGVLSGYARMLTGPAGASRPAPTDQMVGSIEESAAEMVRLVERLNTLAAVASRAVTMTPVVTSVADLLAPIAQSVPAVPVTVRGVGHAASVRVDPMRLREALAALLTHLAGHRAEGLDLELCHLVPQQWSERVAVLVGRSDAIERMVAAQPWHDQAPTRPTLDSMVAEALIELHDGQLRETTDGIFVIDLPMSPTTPCP